MQKGLTNASTNATTWLDSLSAASFVHGFAINTQTNQLQVCPLCERYERGSQINKMSQALNLRHVVAGLSALKYVGYLYLTSFVPGAK
jgi:hypothetical protein